jgi:hypothetical protein
MAVLDHRGFWFAGARGHSSIKDGALTGGGPLQMSSKCDVRDCAETRYKVAAGMCKKINYLARQVAAYGDQQQPARSSPELLPFAQVDA